MGSDELHKKRHAEREERHAGSRTPNPDSYLIVTEGEKTERLYFQEIASEVASKREGAHLDVPEISVSGEGRGTMSLVKRAEELMSTPGANYQHVWVVFDRDDFENFEEAITCAEADGFHVAWSNQSFEYWLCLHFEYCDAAMSRGDWCRKLGKHLKENGLCRKGYSKNLPNMYSMLQRGGRVETAVAHARMRRRCLEEEGILEHPDKCDPCTCVDMLVEELRGLLDA